MKCKHCNRRAGWGQPGGKTLRCRDHVVTGDMPLRNKKCVCKKNVPVFNYPGARVGVRCKDCLLPGMCNVKAPRCLTCTRTASFNFEGLKNPLYCETHAAHGMSYVRSISYRTPNKVSAVLVKFWAHAQISDRVKSAERVCKTRNDCTENSKSLDGSVMATHDECTFTRFKLMTFNEQDICNLLMKGDTRKYDLIQHASGWSSLLLRLHIEAHMCCCYISEHLDPLDAIGVGVQSRCRVPGYNVSLQRKGGGVPNSKKQMASTLLWGFAVRGKDKITGHSTIDIGEGELCELRGPLRRVNAACATHANIAFYREAYMPGTGENVVLIMGVAIKTIAPGDRVYANYAHGSHAFVCAVENCEVKVSGTRF